MRLTISRITIYPVKSLAGVALASADLGRAGLAHDREWMVVDEDGIFVTQRRFPWMATIGTSVNDEALTLSIPGSPPLSVPVVRSGNPRLVKVWTSDCEVIDQGDAAAAALSGFLGRQCRLVRMREGFVRPTGDSYRQAVPGATVGFADGAPVMLHTEASLQDLNSRLDEPVSMNRFRPNLVLAGADPFEEDRWQRIRVNGIVLHLVKDCIRCEIPTIEQESGAKGVEPMETLESYRSGPLGTRFGRGVVHEGSGTLRVGDEVEVLT